MSITHGAVGCHGRQVITCGGQGDDEDLFIFNCDLPDEDQYWVRSGKCLYIDVDAACTTLPTGHTAVEVSGTTYDNCDACIDAIEEDRDIPDSCSCSTSEWNDMCDGSTASCGDGFEISHKSYKIVGFDSTFFTIGAGLCASCTGGVTGSTPQWDGTFDCEEGGPCAWPLDVTSHGSHQHNGLALVPGPGLRLHATFAYWQVQVNCQNISGSSVYTIWEGRKAYGATPMGTYTRESSVTMCSTAISSVFITTA